VDIPDFKILSGGTTPHVEQAYQNYTQAEFDKNMSEHSARRTKSVLDAKNKIAATNAFNAAKDQMEEALQTLSQYENFRDSKKFGKFRAFRAFLKRMAKDFK